jgi:hypothetical protein
VPNRIFNFKMPMESLLVRFRDTGLVDFTMSDSIDTITEVESIERRSQGTEPFRRFIRQPEPQHNNEHRRIMSEQDAQVQKRLTSSSERILSACAGALLTSLLGTNKPYTSIQLILNACLTDCPP